MRSLHAPQSRVLSHTIAWQIDSSTAAPLAIHAIFCTSVSPTPTVPSRGGVTAPPSHEMDTHVPHGSEEFAREFSVQASSRSSTMDSFTRPRTFDSTEQC
ncbi:hypothetical protein Ae201684P_009932 [Aphanomyces euteiches]|uniref:Uncharacterized protein n=1 Tax=Aphanomyces euteiches TaxID=100861 RepID=A0A6G0XH96_9STRA|nr:hypothetical protein Ae201684_005016 [Aphanomyces euteiches]KAH9082609.1 hypothetical protein Ae201684P_009932 [Aphanomyces euteiches]